MREQRNGGFTLVELMLALTVMLVAVGGAVSAQLHSRRLIRQSQETKLAMSDLQSAMEEVLVLPIDEIAAADSPFAPGAPIVAWNDRHLPAERIVTTLPGFAVAGGGGPVVVPDPLEIRLDITWTAFDGRARSLSLSTMKTR